MAHRVGPMPFITPQREGEEKKVNPVSPVSPALSKPGKESKPLPVPVKAPAESKPADVLPVEKVAVTSVVNEVSEESPAVAPLPGPAPKEAVHTDAQAKDDTETLQLVSEVVPKKRGRKKKVLPDAGAEPDVHSYVKMPLSTKKRFLNGKYLYSVCYDARISNDDFINMMLDSFFEKYLKDIQNAVLGKRAAR